MLANDSEYIDVLKKIKADIAETQRKAASDVNSRIIQLYWRIGSELNKRAVWGSKHIDSLSRDIRAAFPGIAGFSVRNLKYMKKFAAEIDEELCSSCCTIPWGHVMVLLDKTAPGDRRN
ncbi:DUF1016 N-terminal domain-containing protein [Adlercreutzia sp. R7]|uniref:DUF1016 N-terminal domain-containing protein n=2 Tax=Adlercreutzia wanghongyangiae TaxID=3111451 RepID=A0ABU6IG22_9ACTN|nr:DUF1016 N-terminal domain-containing protein [Adlercreutzia sp. R7]